MPKIPSKNKQQQQAMGKIIKGIGSTLKPVGDITVRMLKKSAKNKLKKKKMTDDQAIEDIQRRTQKRDEALQGLFTR